MISALMGDLYRLIWCLIAGLFRSRAALQAEILTLRHQLNVPRRQSPKHPVFTNIDRLVFAALYSLTPHVLDALKILKPATMIRWHRAFEPIGAGSPDLAAGGQRYRLKFASSFVR